MPPASPHPVDEAVYGLIREMGSVYQGTDAGEAMSQSVEIHTQEIKAGDNFGAQSQNGGIFPYKLPAPGGRNAARAIVSVLHNALALDDWERMTPRQWLEFPNHTYGEGNPQRLRSRRNPNVGQIKIALEDDYVGLFVRRVNEMARTIHKSPYLRQELSQALQISSGALQRLEEQGVGVKALVGMEGLDTENPHVSIMMDIAPQCTSLARDLAALQGEQAEDLPAGKLVHSRSGDLLSKSSRRFTIMMDDPQLEKAIGIIGRYEQWKRSAGHEGI